MKPLEPLKGKIQVLGGLDNLSANAGKDGGGDHARASSTFLTGVRIKKTSGADIRAGVSIDQLAAQRIGHLTRFPSLELTCDGVRKSGSCDSGYSCAYEWNMSWRTPNTPMAPEPNPRMVFERLFGSGSPGERQTNFAQRQEQAEVDPRLRPGGRPRLQGQLASARPEQARRVPDRRPRDRGADPAGRAAGREPGPGRRNARGHPLEPSRSTSGSCST